jgi:patatin-related protein
MTGGVSLAIWMGGVARELNLLDQASRLREAAQTPYQKPALNKQDGQIRDLYGQLLELLDQTVRIDVLSGTSAGGINAALLGLCHALGVDLGPLRDMWFDAGALLHLLRDPATTNPPSLLQGDKVLLAQLKTSMDKLVEPPWHKRNETTIYITSTLLTGETSRFTDSYGTLVPDVDHRCVFRFDGKSLCDPNARQALALAARASASFPAAFEPAFLPFDNQPSQSGDLPAMGEYADITRNHWAADGGLLANRPIGPLLQSVFDRPADRRRVRRLLLYVVPDPGGSADPSVAPPPDTVDAPYPLGKALVKDLGAALSQTIAGELSAIRAHNDRVTAMDAARLRLAELGATTPLAGAGAWAGFVDRQSNWFVTPLVDRLMREVTTLPLEQMPKSWRDAAAPGGEMEQRCRAAAAQRVGEPWTEEPAAGDWAAFARFGRPAYDAAKATVLAIIRDAYVLAANTHARVDLANLSTAVDAAFHPKDEYDLDSAVHAGVVAAATNSTDLFELAATLAEQYATARAAGAVSPAAPVDPSTPGPNLAPGLAEAWSAVADLVVRALPLFRELAGQAAAPTAQSTDAASKSKQEPPENSLQGRRRRAANNLVTYLAYLAPSRDHNTDPDPGQVAMRLLQLHVQERAMLPVDAEVDQPVEFVQVSANTRTTLVPRRATAASKLTGIQFHHFGAFYKTSWRANDWMWGRLDGAGWLIHLLLDPRRLMTVVESDLDSYKPGSRAKTILDRLTTITQDAPDDAAAVLKELAYLDHSDWPMPASLPATSLWLAAGWQRLIAQVELPVVAREVLINPSRTSSPWAQNVLEKTAAEPAATYAAQAAVAAVGAGRSPTKAQAIATKNAREIQPQAELDERELVQLLTTCPVPDETFASEEGEPLLTQTAAKAAAVVAATTTSVAAPPAAIRPLLSTLRTVTLAGYRLVDVLNAGSRWLILLGAGTATVGGFLAVQNSTLLGLTGTVIALIGLYLIALGAWSLNPRLLAALIGITLAVGAVALCLPWVRDRLYGTSPPAKSGWLGRTVLPWLHASWWGGLVIVVAVVLVVSLVNFVAARRKRPKLPSSAG